MARCRRRYSLAVELTSLCNLQCRHCYNAFDHTGSGSLPADQLLGLLQRALDEVPLKRVTLAGGEPFATEALFEALQMRTAHGVAADIISNGTLVDVLRQAKNRRFRRMHLRISGPLPSCMVEHRDFPGIRFGWCPIGTTEQDFALGPDGHLRHCLLRGSSLGDARQHSFSELMLGPAVLGYRRRAPEFCRGCVELPRCLGGCGAAALAVMGTETALDPLVLQHVDPAFAHRVRCAKGQHESPQ